MAGNAKTRATTPKTPAAPAATCLVRIYPPGEQMGRRFAVDGDLSINGNFNCRGLIYVGGDLKINGTCWVLSSIIVRGKTTIKIANGDCTILYSLPAIQETLNRYGGNMVTLSWFETR